MKTITADTAWGQRILCLSVPMLVYGLMLVYGCAAIWQRAPSSLTADRWSINVPDGWMHLTTPSYEMLSLDGPYLQYIFIQEQPLSQRLSYTRRIMDNTMLPHEAAGVVQDSLMSDPKIRNYKLLSSEPTTLSGTMGFRLVYTYTDNQNVDMKCVYYGALRTHTFFTIRYTAAQRHYFQKNAADFEQMLESLRFS